MSENLRLYTTIVFGFEHVLRLVPDDAWERPSPCEGWTTRQVAGHAMAVVNNVAARVGVGELLDPFGDGAAIAGEHPLVPWRGARDRYMLATDQPGALQRVIQSTLGEVTLDQYLGLMSGDTLVHSWDVARGAGVDERLDPHAVAVVYVGYLARDASTMRVPGRYGSAIELDDDAGELDRLIAFTGRDPNWRAPANA